MAKDVNAWVDYIADKPLPILSQSAESIRRLAQYNEPGLEEVGKVILSDPGCALQLFRHLQELQGEQLEGEVRTIKHATLLLGFDWVIGLPDELPLVNNQLSGANLRGYSNVVVRSFHAAQQAFEWAKIRADRNPEELQLAALLNYLGELVLWCFGHDEMLQIEQIGSKRSFQIEDAENAVLGFPIALLSRMLARRWHLPSFVSDCMVPMSALDPRALGSILAAKLAHEVELGWYRERASEYIDMVGDYLGLSPEDGITHVHRRAVAVSREMSFPEVQPVAAGLLDTGENRRVYKPRVARVKPISKQSEVYENAVKALQTPIQDVNDVLHTAMKGLWQGAGLSRVFFAMLTPTKDALRVRYAIGTDDYPKINKFQLSLSSTHLFTKLMQRSQSVWINDTNRKKFWPFVPKEIKDLRAVDFFAMSVFADSRAVGMFYGDRASSDIKLDAGSHARFKRICILTGQALANLSKLGNAH